MKDKQRAIEYISSFIDLHGGIPAVMKDTGIGKQTVWQLSTKRNAASPTTIKRFAEVYKDFDANQARGLLVIPGGETTSHEPEPNWQALYLAERDENNRLRKVNERLSISMLEKAGLLTDQEGVKIGSGSQLTAEEWVAQVLKAVEYRQETWKVEGLVRYDGDEPVGLDAKIIELTRSVPVFQIERTA